jgi:pimeloyl-ACP methyl ester carboxylesterase
MNPPPEPGSGRPESHGAEGRRTDDGAARRRMLEGLPVAEGRLTAAGVSTIVLQGGAGPPLILLQGGIECGGAYWAPVIPALARERRLVVPDVPGLGGSDPAERLDGPAFSAWLAELIGMTCREPPDVVAHSLVGSLAARFAVARGHLLRRLAIYAAPGIGPYRMPLGLRIVAIRFTVRPTERNSERFERWAFVDRDAVRARDPGWFDAFSAYTLARARVRHVKRAMGQLVRAGTKRVPPDELRRIPLPVALVWGSRDRFVPLRFAQDAADELGWPLHAIKGAGHVPHIEQPDAFLRALAVALGGGADDRGAVSPCR